MEDRKFIVAEVSKNWTEANWAKYEDLLSQRFEKVINTNLERGYVLHSWKLDRIFDSRSGMNETIVAVFVKKASSDRPFTTEAGYGLGPLGTIA